MLVGGSGMLGRAWRELLDRLGVAYAAPPRAELDLTRPDTIDRQVTGKHRVVINCSAWTDVDGAETHLKEAEAVNGVGVGRLAQRCKEMDATLIHYSTDYVFDGQGTRPYPVDHPTDPVNAYGRSKLMGEQLLMKSGCRYLLARTSWLYAPWGKNFVRTIAGLAGQRDSLKVVHDQRGRPTSSEHLAGATWSLVGRGATGVYHVTDGGQCTWHEFACEVVRQTNPRCRVEPCTTAEFPRPAKRPAYSVLDLARVEAILGPMPDWKRNLADVLARLN